jgi:hypothetical protein
MLQREQNRVIETSLQPQTVRLLPVGNDPRAVMVGVTWTADGWCSGQFQAQAAETASEVRFGAVISREYPNGVCAGVGTGYDMAWAQLTLKAPLGTRLAVRASDGSVLPVFAADDGFIRTGATSADIKQFGGLNDNPPLSLRKSVHITDQIAVAQVVKELGLLPPYPTDTFHCPMNDGSYYAIDLHYAAGGDTTLKVDAEGCQAVYMDDSKRPIAWVPVEPQCTDCAGPPGIFTLFMTLLGE